MLEIEWVSVVGVSGAKSLLWCEFSMPQVVEREDGLVRDIWAAFGGLVQP